MLCSGLKLTVAVVAMAAVLQLGSGQEPMCNNPDAQVLILGAGFSGIAAAKTLHENCITDFLIIDQFFEPGGRVRSTTFAGSTIEFGAQWILSVNFSEPYETLHPIYRLAVECGNLSLKPLTPNTAAYDDGGSDVTGSYFESLFRLSAIRQELIDPGSIIDDLLVQRDFTAEAGFRLSGWRPVTPEDENAEWTLLDFGFAVSSDASSFNRQIVTSRATVGLASFLVTDPRGFGSLATCALDRFLDDSTNDSRLILNTFVQKIRWSDTCVCVDTVNLVTGESKTYCAPYAIVTFSLTVQQDPNLFEPPLPARDKYWAIQTQTMSNFLKIWVLFNETFWDRGANVDWIQYIDRVRGREYYPRFVPLGDFLPGQPPILQALLTGSFAGIVASQNKLTTMEQIYEIMVEIYGENASPPLDLIQHDFITDPLFYGDFSYPTPGTNDTVYDQLQASVGSLYFAGEHTERIYRATVHGAWYSGVRAVEDLLVSFDGGSLRIVFVDDSPTSSYNGTVSAYIQTNRPVNILTCSLYDTSGNLLNGPVDCQAGGTSWFGLTPGVCYEIRIFASNGGADKRNARRRICVPLDSDSCTANLINCGTSIQGGLVTIQFRGSGPASFFTCTLDGSAASPCESPVHFKELASGSHRLVVRPMGCPGGERQLRVRFTTE